MKIETIILLIWDNYPLYKGRKCLFLITSTDDNN